MGDICSKSSQTTSAAITSGVPANTVNTTVSPSVPVPVNTAVKTGTKLKGIPMNPGQWFPIKNPFVNVGLGWDFEEGDTYDLDASVTAFDECANVVQAIYFSNKDGLSGAIHHHGDNLTGVGEGDDEVISIHLDRIPPNVLSLAVTVNSYRGNSIIKAKEAFIRIFDGQTMAEIGMYILNKTKDCVGLMLGLFERDPQSGGWFFRVMADPIEGTVVTNSFESIKTLLTGYSATFQTDINYVPRHPMPGETEFIPETWIDVRSPLIYVGLGWDVLPGNIYDLDASIVTLDASLNVVDIVYHKNMKSQDGAVVHFGDNRTGIGEGDDEVLSINFNAIDPRVNTLAVIVNSFKGNSMIGLRSAFIRLFEQNSFIGCHVLGQGTETIGLLLGLFRRDTVNGIWLFQVMIQPLPGNEAPLAIENLRGILTTHQMPL